MSIREQKALNICRLIQSMFELGLKPKFYAEAA